MVIFSGGPTASDEQVLDEVRAIRDGGGFGSIIGRNSFQRKKPDAAEVPGHDHGHLRRHQEVIVLAGDVGGTKTALALFDKTARGPVLVREDTLSSRGFETLEAAVERFLSAGPRPKIEGVCLGVAGPVVDGRCVATNLPWVIDERALASAIPAPRVKLLNDLEVAAHGVLSLPEAELRTLQPGTPAWAHGAHRGRHRARRGPHRPGRRPPNRHRQRRRPRRLRAP